MSSDHYLTLAGEGEGELREKASRFLAWSFQTIDEDHFKARLQRITREHHTSRHVCHAWVLGEAGERHRANDSGEPSGTAGRPILNRIQAAGLTYCAVVVVRYFGGTLLGKAGLVKAYGEAAQLALDAAPVEERVIRDRVVVHCSYAQLVGIRHTVSAQEGVVIGTDFTDACRMTIALPRSVVQEQLEAWYSQGLVASRYDQEK